MFLTLLTAGFVASIAAASGPLQGTVEARKVVRKDTGREVFIPASEASPNDVIEYRLTYANSGDAAVRNVSVTDPIPSGTEYLSHTATRPEKGAVEFSIDGGESYHSWPVRYQVTLDDGSREWREATPDMITHIRWTFSGEFEPDMEITLSYRAVVK
jgi:uncharacterized repeat protein (TIGR01451 family)